MLEVVSTGVAIAVTQSVCPARTPRNFKVSDIFADSWLTPEGLTTQLRQRDRFGEGFELYCSHIDVDALWVSGCESGFV
jgi:hypothetical protein